MNLKLRVFSRTLVGVLAATGGGFAFAAETPVSVVASACTAIPANRVVNLNTSAPLVPGQDIMLAVAVDTADASDLVVTGPVGVQWQPLGGHKSEVRNRSVALLRGRAMQSVASGAALQLGFSQMEAATDACVRGMRYTSFIEGESALLADGQSEGSAIINPAVTGKQPVNGAMAIAAFIFEANPNALTLNAGAVSDGGACNAALDLCLRVMHQGDVSGTVTLSMDPASTSNWQVTLATMAAPGLFKDGFE